MRGPALRSVVKVVDGARGEGGGQVARLALALAAATGTPTTVENVRANREQPGLKAGHVAAFRALAQLCDGTVEGADLGSTRVTLRPGATVGGEHRFAIETAGPVTLLAQALLPACVAARQPFTLHLQGGTNVAWAPQWDDYARVHLPLLRRLGIEAEPALARRGFFPQGGGEVTLEVATPSLAPASFDEAGEVRAIHAVVASHGLPTHVVDRAKSAILDALPAARIEVDAHRGPGTGFAVSLRAECRHGILGADAVGKKGVRVEQVIEGAAAALKAELASGAGVDVHQADQLPVFLALAGGGSYTARMLSLHARTVLEMLPEFLPVRVEVRHEARKVHVILARGADR
jgi:RNA 3'-terminal phosphate cyclase (ATP)